MLGLIEVLEAPWPAAFVYTTGKTEDSARAVVVYVSGQSLVGPWVASASWHRV
jgi:hypothetical protein